MAGLLPTRWRFEPSVPWQGTSALLVRGLNLCSELINLLLLLPWLVKQADIRTITDRCLLKWRLKTHFLGLAFSPDWGCLVFNVI